MADETMSASEKKKEDWMNSKWRPMMGWMYMAICSADFMIFPILWSLLQTLAHQTITQWQPLTLQGAGLFHVAMGAVLGIAAMGRTQEKLAGANNGGLNSTPSFGGSSGFNSSPSIPSTSSPASTGFGSPTAGFGAAASTPTPPATGGFGTSFDSAPAAITPAPSILPPPTITGKGKAKIAD